MPEFGVEHGQFMSPSTREMYAQSICRPGGTLTSILQQLKGQSGSRLTCKGICDECSSAGGRVLAASRLPRPWSAGRTSDRLHERSKSTARPVQLCEVELSVRLTLQRVVKHLDLVSSLEKLA
jgi:hypothetical protein